MFLQRAAADYAPLTRGLGRMLTLRLQYVLE
jgi:hypothetical protein